MSTVVPIILLVALMAVLVPSGIMLWVMVIDELKERRK